MDADVDQERTPKARHERDEQGPVKRAATGTSEPEAVHSTGAAAAAVSLQRTPGAPAAGPQAILALQRTAGNRAVQRLIQAKLMVGPAGDQYEQEADAVADQVMTMPAPGSARAAGPVQREGAGEEDEVREKPLVAGITPLVQRNGLDEEEIQEKPLVQRAAAPEEEEIQTKPLVQRAAGPEEDEGTLQGKALAQRQAEPGQEEEEEKAEDKIQPQRLIQRSADGSFEAGEEVEGQLQGLAGGGSPLPGEVREYMEPRFGADFGGVRVHSGGESAALNRSLSAQAFTHGQDIFLGEGAAPATSDAGKQLLAHELTHVVQQTGGAVQSKSEEPGESKE